MPPFDFIQDINNQLQLATEAFLEGDDCLVDFNKREVCYEILLLYFSVRYTAMQLL